MERLAGARTIIERRASDIQEVRNKDKFLDEFTQASIGGLNEAKSVIMRHYLNMPASKQSVVIVTSRMTDPETVSSLLVELAPVSVVFDMDEDSIQTGMYSMIAKDRIGGVCLQLIPTSKALDTPPTHLSWVLGLGRNAAEMPGDVSAFRKHWSKSLHKKILKPLFDVRPAYRVCSYVALTRRKSQNLQPTIRIVVLWDLPSQSNIRTEIAEEVLCAMETQFGERIAEIVVCCDNVASRFPERKAATKQIICPVPRTFRLDIRFTLRI
jgi:hypothetical protein